MNTMGIIQRGTSSVMVELPPDQTTRLIEQARRERVPVDVVPKRDGATTLTGVLEQSDGEILRIVGAPGAFDASLRSIYCDVSFRLRDEEYMFTTVTLDVIEHADGHRLELSYPPRVHTWQRRRFVRAAVADSAAVFLRPCDGARGTSAEGSILNLSLEGMAFRIQTQDADAHGVGEAVNLRFTVSPNYEEIDLNATVISKTPGGTAGTVIVGVQFEHSQSTERARDQLAAALKAYL